MQLDRRGAETLFQVAHRTGGNRQRRHREQRIHLWLDQDLQQSRLCAAIVDGLTFAGNIIETGTGSYRLAHARAVRDNP